MRVLSAYDAAHAEGQDKDYLYNALDVTGTLEVSNVLDGILTPAQWRYYRFNQALQGPAQTMMSRGLLVDTFKRDSAVAGLRRELASAIRQVNKLDVVDEVWDGQEKETGDCKLAGQDPKRKSLKHKWPRGVPDSDPAKVCEQCGAPRFKRQAFNPNSPPQCLHLFHDLLGLPKYQNKLKKVSVDEDTLERYGRQFPKLEALVETMLNIRSIKKQIGVLTARLSSSNRFMQSVNVGAAWTSRFSSSKNPFGEGSNTQNLAERHRNIFIADPGYTLFYADLKTAESFVVAYMSGDDQYIKAHLSGDTHTYVARLVWPELPWQGDIKADKGWAKENYFDWDKAPGHDIRFQAKRVQHATNIGQSPYGLAHTAHIPVALAAGAQERYFSAFPYIRTYQNYVRRQVTEGETLVNPLGFGVNLFGRRDDDHTYKQGLAFYQQSPVANTINMGIWRLWKLYDVGGSEDPGLVQLIAQVHDAILGQIPTSRLQDGIAALYQTMSIPIPITDRVRGESRVLTIPVEVSVGQNWGKANDDPTKGPLNPNGLRDA